MIPVYNGVGTVGEVVGRARDVLAQRTRAYEFVLVNDGSEDGSWERIVELAAAEDVRGIDLSRNYGQHNALLAGLRAARYEVVVTIDDDLQNPPEEIPKLLDALGPGCDVVYGEPISKQHGFGRRLATQLVVRALRLLGGRTAPMVSAFRAFRTDLREGFAEYTGPDVSIDALLTWRTDRFRTVPVRHDPRAQGKSNYSAPQLIRHALTMITAFSTRPLRLATSFGFLVIAFGIAILAYVLIRVATEGNGVPGFPFLASIISIFAGAQLFAIGVIGEYLARIHVRVMDRPSYVIDSEVGPGASPGGGANADGLCRSLAWDSEFWGFPVARVVPRRLDRATAQAAASWCEANGIACAYLLADAADAETAAAAEAAGFVAVDTRVTMERPGGPIASLDAGADGLRLRRATADDGAALAAIAGEAHLDTRFFFDPRFPPGRAREMYEAWVRKGLEPGPHELLVAERGGRPVGYLLSEGDPPRIDLIAVAADLRGQGIGRAMVASLVAGSPSGAASVVTQARNVGALRLYEECGFRVTAAETWYHRWS